MGSQLYHEKELIWPGPAASYYFPYKLMDKLLEPNLVVGDIIRSYSLLQCYGSLIQDLNLAVFVNLIRLLMFARTIGASGTRRGGNASE